MRHKTLKMLFVVATLCVAGRAAAWENFGHTVISYAAEQLLHPEVRQKCRKYLGTTVTYQASWMDQYRSIEPYTDCDKWHSTNIDAKYKVVVGVPTTGAYHIERIRKEMMNGGYKTMPDSLVKINLQYLIHMIPDHHCPVHVRWDKKEHPEFFYSLKNKGKKLGYHGFWDGALKRWRKDWTADKYFEQMEKLSKGEAKKVVKGDGYKWTQQTADVARLCFAITPADTDIAKLSKEKQAEIHAIVDRQAQRGAYRLAAVLNDIFKE